MLTLLVALEAFQVAFLWLHDWVPLPPLNDVRAVRAADSTRRLIIVTLIQSVPYSIGLVFSVIGLSEGMPGWLWDWLWISYGLLFIGELRAWWIPYLVKPDPERAARYLTMFGATHSFLPERNGMKPNTLHVILHGFTAATVVVLGVLAVG